MDKMPDNETLELMKKLNDSESKRNSQFDLLMEYMGVIEGLVGFAGPIEGVIKELEKRDLQESERFTALQSKYDELLTNFLNSQQECVTILVKYDELVKEREWISIEDRLPEVNSCVLGYRPYATEQGDETITILKYEGGSSNVDHHGIHYGFERAHSVSHWKPLPSPPLKTT